MKNEASAKGLAVLSGTPSSGASLLGYGIAAKLAENDTRPILLDLNSNQDVPDRYSHRNGSENCDTGNERLRESISKTDAGFDMVRLSPLQARVENEDSLENIYCRICDLSSEYDSIIISVSGGLNPLAMLAAGMCEEVLIVIDSDASSVASAYCLLKTLAGEGMGEKITAVFSNVDSAESADSLKAKFDSVTTEFLGLKLQNGGFILPDPYANIPGLSEEPETGRAAEFIRNTHFDTLKLFQTETTAKNLAGIDSTVDDPDDLKMDNL